jgi:transketolase
VRQTFIKTLLDLGDKNPKIMLLTGDLGYTIVEPFAERFPDRFINAGVAEQNMIGLATGLAESGFIPFVYTIVTFATLRPYEFIRNGPVLHRSKVRIIGVGHGFDYGSAGVTHHGLEDVAVMRVQPGMNVIVPADFEQARSAIKATWDYEGPVYYGIGKDEKYTVAGLEGRFEPGKAQVVREGKDITILTMGPVTLEVMKAAELLQDRRIQAKVVIVASVSPPPVQDLVGILSQYKTVLTVESQYVTGGLGSLVAEVIADHGLACRLVRCGVRKSSDGLSGSLEYLYRRHGLSADQITNAALLGLQTIS